MILGDRPLVARDALRVELERYPRPPGASDPLAWVLWRLNDRRGARVALSAAGVSPAEGPSDEVTPALAAVAAGDTVAAIRIMTAAVAKHGLDPAAHALLADLRLARDPVDRDGTIEAFAALVLAPTEPTAWRRWGMIQTVHERYLEASGSFERYFALAGAAGASDSEARDWVAKIRSMMPGGELARRGLREAPVLAR
jgi:hypothetical protein